MTKPPPEINYVFKGQSREIIRPLFLSSTPHCAQGSQAKRILYRFFFNEEIIFEIRFSLLLNNNNNKDAEDDTCIPVNLLEQALLTSVGSDRTKRGFKPGSIQCKYKLLSIEVYSHVEYKMLARRL